MCIIHHFLRFTDSQDIDYYNESILPEPFGTYNYICDVSAHTRGVNYKGRYTAEISGWSEHFLTYIAALEGLQKVYYKSYFKVYTIVLGTIK